MDPERETDLPVLVVKAFLLAQAEEEEAEVKEEAEGKLEVQVPEGQEGGAAVLAEGLREILLPATKIQINIPAGR
jgi:hypothetical protein